MAMLMPMSRRWGVGSWVAGGVTVASLALTGCSGEAYGDGEGENIESVAQALCAKVKLAIAPAKTLPPNSSALLTASNATCAAGEVAEYRFMYKRDGDPTPYTEFRGWSTEPTATFDNAELPSGKYTLQVRARNVGSSSAQNSQATVVVNSGEVCSSVTLKAAPTSPVLPGKTITLSSQATCTAGSPEYQYSVKAPGGSYAPLGTWTEGHAAWDTSGLALGKYTLRVYARRAGNISSYESERTLSFTLADTCQAVTMDFSPAGAQPSGTMVVVDAHANCPGGSTPEFRFHYGLKTGPEWLLLQDWSSDAAALWDTTGLVEGTYQVRVQTRAPGVTTTQASKVSDFKLTAPTCDSAVCGVSDGCCPAGCDSLTDGDCP